MTDGMDENVKEIQTLQEERVNLERERKRLEEERIKIEKARIQLEEERIKKTKDASNPVADFQNDVSRQQVQKDPEILKIIEEQHKKQDKKKKNHQLNFFLFFVVGILAIVAVVLIRMNGGESIEDIIPVGSANHSTSDVKAGADSKEDTSGVTPELKEFLDSYESYFDQYYEAMESKSSLVTATKLVQMLAELGKMEKRAEEIGKMDLSDVDRQYYLEVMARITEKGLNRLSQ